MAQLWRVSGLQPWGTGDLELGELQLWVGGSRADAAATVTCSVTPSSGTVADLVDDDPTTRAVFTAAQRTGVLTIVFDMGVDVPDIDTVKIGLGLTKAKSIRWFTLAKYESGTWVDMSFNQSVGFRIGSVVFTTAEDMVSIERFTPTWIRLLIKRWYSGNGLVEHGVPINSAQISSEEIQYVDRDGVSHPSTALTGNSAPSPFLVTTSGPAYPGGLYEAWHAFDHVLNSSASRWVADPTNTGDQWITVKLDQPVELVSLRYCAGDDVGLGSFIQTFDILGSTTGAFSGEERVLHRVLAANNPPGWASNTVKEFSFMAAGTATGTEDTPDDLFTFDVGGDEMPGAFEFDSPALFTYRAGVELTNNDNLEGDGEVLGTVKIEADPADDTVPDIPVRRLVRLHRDMDGKLAQSTYSDAATGAYAFRHVNRAYTYHALAFDNTHSYRLVGADGIVPTLMS